MHKTVASLALLKVNWDTLRKDYIENFIPFAVTLMNQKNSTCAIKTWPYEL